MSKEIALCLSGGGARGAIHVGVLKYLEDEEYHIKSIAGTSIGALIGVMIASGMKSDQILNLMGTKAIRHFVKASFSSRNALFNMSGVRKILNEHIPHNDLEKLEIPLTACSTNLTKDEASYISTGKLDDAVIASCSIPIVFDPINIDGDLHCDGGLLNNLPVQALNDQAYTKLAVHVNNYNVPELTTYKDIVQRVINVAVGHTAKEGRSLADKLIEPYLPHPYPTLDLKATNELFNIGYNEAKKILG